MLNLGGHCGIDSNTNCVTKIFMGVRRVTRPHIASELRICYETTYDSVTTITYSEIAIQIRNTIHTTSSKQLAANRSLSTSRSGATDVGLACAQSVVTGNFGMLRYVGSRGSRDTKRLVKCFVEVEHVIKILAAIPF